MLEKYASTLEKRQEREKREERTTIITITTLFVLYLLTAIVLPIISIVKWSRVVIGGNYSGNLFIAMLIVLSVAISYLFGVSGITFVITSRLSYLKHKRKKKIEKISFAIIILLTAILVFALLTYKHNPVLSAWIILILSCLGIALNVLVMIMAGGNVTD